MFDGEAGTGARAGEAGSARLDQSEVNGDLPVSRTELNAPAVAEIAEEGGLRPDKDADEVEKVRERSAEALERLASHLKDATSETGVVFAVKFLTQKRASYAVEDAVYRRLEQHPGIAPAYFGRFVVNQEHPTLHVLDVLLLERWGGQLYRFGDLKPKERAHLYGIVKRLHLDVKLSVDIQPRNVLFAGSLLRDDDENPFRLIDFERAKYHDCPGEASCAGLARVRQEIHYSARDEP
ncbi:hypothetical protein JCM6882_003608 [Rhodosporidiobolus microsporus]